MADSDSPAEARRSEGGSQRLARSAGVFGLATITSRILGLVREQVMAYYFGAGDANDAFRVASRIPNLVRDLVKTARVLGRFGPKLPQIAEALLIRQMEEPQRPG